jgi:hypothetical protein
MSEQLDYVYTLIKAGNRADARQILTEVLTSDPENDRAWVLMAAAVETHDLRQECLEEALKFNPENQTAIKALASLKRRKQTTPIDDTHPAQAPVTDAKPKSRIAKNIAYTVGAIAVVAILACLAIFLLRSQSTSPTDQPITPTEIEWQEFTEEGRFSVTVPRALIKTMQKEETQIGEIDIHMFTTEYAGIEYGVGYNDYPPDLIGDPQLRLDGARDGILANVNGKLLSEQPISIDDHPGRELTAEATENSRTIIAKVRIYLVENTLYQVLAVAPKDLSSSPDIAKFMDSFKLR